MEILQFIGTCSNPAIGNFAESNGRKSSWNNAKKAIKNFSKDLYNDLSLDLNTYYEDYTNIKTAGWILPVTKQQLLNSII